MHRADERAPRTVRCCHRSLFSVRSRPASAEKEVCHQWWFAFPLGRLLLLTVSGRPVEGDWSGWRSAHLLLSVTVVPTRISLSPLNHSHSLSRFVLISVNRGALYVLDICSYPNIRVCVCARVWVGVCVCPWKVMMRSGSER